MHLKLLDKTTGFKKSMDNGALYFEFSDGSRIAMHRDLYLNDNKVTTFESDIKRSIPKATLERTAVYRAFMQRMLSDSTKKLNKLFYKPRLHNDENGVWVNILTASYNALEGFLSKEFLDKVDNTWVGGGDNTTGAAGGYPSVDLKQINTVTYWGIRGDFYGPGGQIVSDIGFGDGRGSDLTKIRDCDNVYFPTSGKWSNKTGDFNESGWTRVIEVSKIDMDNPTNYAPHTYRDIKITMKPNEDLGYRAELINTDNTLTWLNGVFVNTTKESDTVMYIKDGMNFVNYHFSDVKGSEAIPMEHTGFLTAAYDIPDDRKVFTPDFDLAIFKWKGVKISDWSNGYNASYKEYRFLNDPSKPGHLGYDYRMVIDYLYSLDFIEEIGENHILMCNGQIYPRHMYEIVKSTGGKRSKVIFKVDRWHLDELCINAIREFGRTGNTSWYVEKALPRGSDFSLIQFTNSDPYKKIQLNRSPILHKNHPYPMFITFPEFNVGDMVLLDGYYDRYLLHHRNIITYPGVTYRALYSDKSYLNETYVERLHFTEVG